MRAAAWQDEPTNPGGGYWVRNGGIKPESFDVPDFTISESTAPTEEVPRPAPAPPVAEESLELEVLEDTLATDEIPRQQLVALAPKLPDTAGPSSDALPAIDSGAIPRPSRAARLAPTEEDPAIRANEDASTGLFESMDWDEADPYTTGSFPSVAFAEADDTSEDDEARDTLIDERRPSLALVQSAPSDPEDDQWADHRATPLPVPPRPARRRGTWPPPPPAERAQRPRQVEAPLSEQAMAHVDAWDTWDTWHGEQEAPLELDEDDLYLDRPGGGFPYWVAVLFNASAFVLGFAATFLSGAVTMGSTGLVLFAMTL